MRLKFLIFLVATVLVCAISSQWILIPFCLLELVLIFAICSVLYENRPKLSYILNVLLGFVYASQLFVYYFSGEFISMLMLENVNMMSNLGNELVVYILACIPVAAVLFMPVGKIGWVSLNKKHLLFISAVYAMALAAGHSILPASPYAATADLGIKAVQNEISKARTRMMDKDEILDYFHRDSIPGSDLDIIPMPETKPMSIILMLTEGLSAEVLDVYNDHDRNLTPNLNAMHARSLVFDNYFNHTAATFRAVRGQLFSSHQYDGGYVGGSGLGEVENGTLKNMVDVELVSIVDILKSRGYETCFINPEPGDSKIVDYSYSFGVDTLISGDYTPGRERTDKEIFEVLTSTVRKYEADDKPYFIILYNLGTHHGFDSPDLKYGDGSNSYLNKFHNYDSLFGEFFNTMQSEGIFDDTLLIFTADHATYPVPEYKKTFDSTQETFISRIPLFLYTDGIEHGTIDAQGRNTLDLSPTILDILNIEDEENWFLGTSLFRNDEKEYSRVCSIGGLFYQVTDGELKRIKNGNSLVQEIRKYYEISINKTK